MSGYWLDWAIIVLFFGVVVGIGLWVSKRSRRSTTEYFLSGRTMPWWLLGFSMVATTFAADTPLLVTDIVRKDGVAGNWVWWVFVLTGMLTVFIYARLWRKSEVLTDMEFYELRYSGRAASFLRGFRAFYLGLVFNVLVMSVVTLAAIKIGGIMLGLTPYQVVWSTAVIVMLFSALGGFRGVVYTDFLLFVIAMIGAVVAAYYALVQPEVGGIDGLLAHEAVRDKIHFFPRWDDPDVLITVLVIPLALQWWSAWYPGAEPGGGGYIAQRMLAAKDENHAVGATFFFNFMHYAIRPWPWILVALASLILYPEIADLQKAFPDIPVDKLGHDMAYPAMLRLLPHGWYGLVLASLIAAYMSTISTHLNWGASYLVNDLYRRFIRPHANERHYVYIAMAATALMMLLSAVLALQLQNAKQIFDIIILFGAGTGLIFLLRWFWWRINAWSEIVAMVISGVVSIVFNFTEWGDALFGYHDAMGVYYAGLFPAWWKYPLVVTITTVAWLLATYWTPATDMRTLAAFYKKVQPAPWGFRPVLQYAERHHMDIRQPHEEVSVAWGIVAMLLGSALVLTLLYSIGQWLYGFWTNASVATAVTIALAYSIYRWLKRSKGIL